MAMTQELDDEWYNQMSQALSSIQPNQEVVATTQSTQGISSALDNFKHGFNYFEFFSQSNFSYHPPYFTLFAYRNDKPIQYTRQFGVAESKETCCNQYTQEGFIGKSDSKERPSSPIEIPLEKKDAAPTYNAPADQTHPNPVRIPDRSSVKPTSGIKRHRDSYNDDWEFLDEVHRTSK